MEYLTVQFKTILNLEYLHNPYMQPEKSIKMSQELYFTFLTINSKTCTSRLTAADGKFLSTNNVMKQIFHLKRRQIQQVFGCLFPTADQSSRQLGCHYLHIQLVSTSDSLMYRHHKFLRLTILFLLNLSTRPNTFVQEYMMAIILVDISNYIQ